MKLRSFLLVAPLLFLAAGSPLAAAAPMSWSELSALPEPSPGLRVTYGKEPLQFGQLRVPAGKGPFPVFILVHGGCWLNKFDLAYFERLAAWLTDQGFATWTIEFRRVGDAGGGWPGTFRDVGQAADSLREIAGSHPLDLGRVYAAGHSAGGQLALWLASRKKLEKSSELFAERPVEIRGVLGLAAVTDLAAYRVGPAESCHAAVDRLLGGSPGTVPARYAATSPRQRLPLGVPQVFIQGMRDPIVSAESVQAYVDAAKKAGDRAVLLPLPEAGHFETSVPVAVNEPALREALRLLTASAK